MISSTAPGPPVPARDTSNHSSTALDVTHPSNPFQVDFVIPYDVSLPKASAKDTGRAQVQSEIKEGYEALLRSLEGEGGLKVGSRKGRSKVGSKGEEEVWVFVGISDEKLVELVERERLVALPRSHRDVLS
jgi:hypothetical protein